MDRQDQIETRRHRPQPRTQQRPLRDPESRYILEVIRLAAWLAWIIWQATR